MSVFGIAPAVANAIARLTGVRLRDLPMSAEKLREQLKNRRRDKWRFRKQPEPLHEGNMPRPYDDVRQWLELVESMGELKRIDGADWNLEIGTMAELIYRERTGTIPALLFDQIKGYPEGFRILFGQQTSYRRLALMAGLPMDSVGLKLVSRFKEKLNKLQPIPPRIVKTGPVFENTMAGDAIDCSSSPCRKSTS